MLWVDVDVDDVDVDDVDDDDDAGDDNEWMNELDVLKCITRIRLIKWVD